MSIYIKQHLVSFTCQVISLLLIVSGCDSTGLENKTADASSVTHYSETSLPIPNVIVSFDWLKEHQGNSDLILVDARSPEEYKFSHILGAINIPYQETYDKVSENSKNVAPVAEINKLFSRYGIRMEKTVVVYGHDTDFRAQARLFWVLETHGHSNVAVLNGGIKNWESSGGKLSRERSYLPKSVFVAEFSADRIADKLQVIRGMRDESIVILDARDKDQYIGEKVKKGIRRAGHIPSAINFPTTKSYAQESSFCSLEDPSSLTKHFQSLKGKRVITYCNSGRSASVMYLALRSIGAQVAVYDGAWREWASDLNCPTILGDKPGSAP